MMKSESRRKIPLYIMCYALFVVVFALTLVIFFIWRVTLLELISMVNGRSYANRSLYMLGMLGIGITLFGVVMGAEPYLRFGVERGQLMRRFIRMVLPLVVIGMLGLTLQLILVP